MGYRSSMIKKAVSWELSKKKRHQQALNDMSCLAEEFYVNKEPSEIFEICKKVLKEKEYEIIEMRFKHGLNYRDIGLKMNITKERVRQIINDATSFLFMILKPEDF